MATTHDEIIASPRRASPLLQLPAELRNIIYSQVTSGHNIVVCGMHKCESCQSSPKPTVHSPPDVLALATTCREIHSETRLLLIAQNRFCGYVVDLMTFFDSYFSDVQMDAITSLCVMAGSDMDFTGLRRLRGLKHVVVKTWDERVRRMASWRHTSRDKVYAMIKRRMIKELGMFGDAEKIEVKVLGQEEGLPRI